MISDVDVRIGKNGFLVWQRIGSVLLMFVSTQSWFCYEVYHQFRDPETGSRSMLYLDGSRYPCHCTLIDNIVLCMNYGECCEYADRSICEGG